MDKITMSIRVTANEKKMLMKRAERLGLSVNSLIRFWINTEPNSPRAFAKRTCGTCNGTGKIDDVNICKKCQGAGFAYIEI